MKLHVCKVKESTIVGVSTGWYLCIWLDLLIGTLWCKDGGVTQPNALFAVALMFAGLP